MAQSGGVEFNEKIYDAKYKDFHRECDRLRERKGSKLSTNPIKIKEYKEGLVRTYNDIVIFINAEHSRLPLESKFDVLTKLNGCLNQLKQAFQRLNFSYEFGKDIHAQIDITKITEISDISSDLSGNLPSTSNLGTVSTQSETENDSEGESIVGNNISARNQTFPPHTDNTGIKEKELVEETDTNLGDFSDISEQTQHNTIDMAPQSAAEFIKLANATINYRFDGDPDLLDGFIDGLELLKELVENENKKVFIKFVMTRLEGEARGLFKEAPNDIDIIINRLKEKIAFEPSKVIEGKFLALRADRSSLLKFSDLAKELASKYNRSLVREGFSIDKAKEITVEKTVEMCRKSAKSDTVKAVLAASSFNEPEEVIAKMIVEINNLKNDKPHASYAHKYNNNHNKNGNFRNSNGNSNQNRNNRNSNNNSIRNHNNSQHRNNSHNSNGSQNNNNYRNNYNNGNNYNNNSRQNYNRSNQSNQTVRHFSDNSGNGQHPGNNGLSLSQ